ncbi:hypothetical protein [Microbispora rosea]|uniref:hypothetical protein n=1 Tax=Microbispora rosea TaxID=58117 RepID=UPI003D8FBB21
MLKQALAAGAITASALIVPVTMQTQPANAAGSTAQVMQNPAQPCPGGRCRERERRRTYGHYGRERGRERGRFEERGRERGRMEERGRERGRFEERGRERGRFEERGRERGRFEERGRERGRMEERGRERGRMEERGRFEERGPR